MKQTIASACKACAARLLLAFAALTWLQAGELEDYVQKPDAAFAWKLSGPVDQAKGLALLELTSQTWRETKWTHQLAVLRPAQVRQSNVAFILITGDGLIGALKTAQAVAEWAGIVCAALTRIPNQPLYGGKKEDALIAFTFDQYLKSNDPTWPLLFPMVKSVVKAMDAVQAHGEQQYGQKIDSFILSGASKRGWTTWLTGAVDPRVKAIAPMVIDMLNLEAQVAWAKKVYGRQSEQIHDYTDLNLVEQMGSPVMKQLNSMVDPYSYRTRYTMHKLLLLGTNDRYWTVDSLQHYWNDLPAPKIVFQTPNAGHDLAGGYEAIPVLAAFCKLTAAGQPIPNMTWELKGGDHPGIRVTLDQPASNFLLWTADSPTRDFRDAKWNKRAISTSNFETASAEVEKPTSGYRAFMIEAKLMGKNFQGLKLSTQVQVVPEISK